MKKGWRNWKKRNKATQETIEKKSFGECQLGPTVDPIEPTKFKAREYKPRFARAAGYRLPEDCTIHCGNGETIKGQAGDYYLCLDQVHEMVLAADLFKKLFLPKIDTELS